MTATAYVAPHHYEIVTPVRTATSTAGRAFRIGPPLTGGDAGNVIAVTPDGKTAYVLSQLSGTVTPSAPPPARRGRAPVITIGTPASFGQGPEVIAITPDGQTAYVSNAGSGTITPSSTATSTAGPPIPVGANPGPIAIAVTP